jgi:ubiquinone/menaquinone biosynthesis C-methylase UbiE
LNTGRDSFTHADASRFTHGGFYHIFYDRHQAEARNMVVDLVAEGSAVLDMACGTGELCFDLALRRNCRVVGLDLSRRMIEFAQRRVRDSRVMFVQGDCTDLAAFEPDEFDYATLLFLLHEIDRGAQVAVLNEALRVARKAVVVDSQAPLPRNLHGLALRVVEVSGGRAHYRSFAAYLSAGGIGGILADRSVRVSVARRLLFWHGCREMVVLERRPTC